MLAAQEIVELYNQRKKNDGPIKEQMRRIRDLANGDIVVPLNELDRNSKTSVANLLVQGLDQMSMRVASTMSAQRIKHVKRSRQCLLSGITTE
jgi:ribosomal protein L16 Arg81 hydroxylase